MTMTEKKKEYMKRIANENGIISALAFDQRGALRKLMQQCGSAETKREDMERIKTIVAETLTPYASSMLLDPEYGLPATKAIVSNTGLLLAYEKTGYDSTTTDRLPDCLNEWSVKRLKEQGADAIKFLLYYDIDSPKETNEKKQAYIERIGAECAGEDIPFFLEILAYDESLQDATSKEYAKQKPHKVIGAMEVFIQPRFGIDVLKVEVPVNMKYVEGFTNDEIVYTKQEAMEYFRKQDAVSTLPYIYLSAGVSADMFRQTLLFASEAGAQFNGVLCGRATWAGSVKAYMENGETGARAWLKDEGRRNIEELNEILNQTACPWDQRESRKESK